MGAPMSRDWLGAASFLPDEVVELIVAAIGRPDALAALCQVNRTWRERLGPRLVTCARAACAAQYRPRVVADRCGMCVAVLAYDNVRTLRDVTRLCVCLRQPGVFSSVQRLQVPGDILGDQGLCLLADVSLQPHCLPNVSVLDFENRSQPTGGQPRWASARRSCISQSGVTGFLHVLSCHGRGTSSFGNVRALTLAGNSIGDYGVRSLVGAPTVCASLTALDVRDARIMTLTWLDELLDVARCLSSLDASHLGTRPHTREWTMPQRPHESLCFLGLRDCLLDAEWADDFRTRGAPNLPGLRVLDLRSNPSLLRYAPDFSRALFPDRGTTGGRGGGTASSRVASTSTSAVVVYHDRE